MLPIFACATSGGNGPRGIQSSIWMTGLQRPLNPPASRSLIRVGLQSKRTARLTFDHRTSLQHGRSTGTRDVFE